MEQEILNALEALQNRGLILYPTDTIWGIGCDATDEEAVRNVYNLKERIDSKALICLASDLEMVLEHVEVPDTARTILEAAKRPTTLIYHNPEGLASNLIAADDTVAIRIASDLFCKELIKRFGKPIVSTSANPAGASTPKRYTDIHPDILKGVDYIVDLYRERQMDTPSRIIKIEEDGSLRVIRD